MIANFVEKNDKFVQRALEILLGTMTWGLLLSPVWLGLLYPPAMVYLLTFVTVYWSYMALKHSIGLYRAWRKYRHELSLEWYEECKKLDFPQLPDKATLPPTLEDIRHLFVIPAVNEPEEILKDCIDSILNQTFPSKQIVIAVSLEEKFSEEMKLRLKKIIGDREKDLCHFLVYVHPAGIVGEAVGDGGANRAWGSSHAVADLRQLGENIRYYTFSNLDSDHVLHKDYVSRFTHAYLTTDKRDNHFFSSAVPLFDNNLWRVPMMMRIEANSVTLGVASDWGSSKEKALKKTFSAFTVSLQTLIDANYFDVALGADDTIFYWRAFFARDGDFYGVPYFIPYSADAVEGKSYWHSHRSLYKQLLRWGWGSIDFPLSIKEFMKNNKVKTSTKWLWFFRHLKERIFLGNIVFLITFGFGIVTAVNPSVKQSSFAYSLPDLMSLILTLTLVFLIPGTYYRRKFSSTMPKNWPLWRKGLVLLEGPLIIFNLLTFSFIPTIHAQTKILLGKRMKDLYHTPKVR